MTNARRLGGAPSAFIENTQVIERCGSIKDTLIPEPYKIWSKVVESHDHLSQPTCITVNRRCDVYFGDADGFVICGASRHWPSRVTVVAGSWGDKGKKDGATARSRLSAPTSLVMLDAEGGKKEFLLFADPANKTLRVVTAAHKVEVQHTVFTVAINAELQPIGLAVVSARGTDRSGRPLLAISEQRCSAAVTNSRGACASPLVQHSRPCADPCAPHRRSPPRVRLVQLESDLKSGMVLASTWPMQCPHGLAVFTDVRDDSDHRLTLFVADNARVHRIDLPTRGSMTSAQPAVLQHAFRGARAVACAAQAPDALILAVADGVMHQIVLLKLGCQVQGSPTHALSYCEWGSGRACNLDGPISASAFHEPVCVAFGCGVLHVGSLGGGKQRGTISIVTPTAFASRFMKAVESIYDTIGFVAQRLN